jgi:hypothetical protein
MHGQVAVSQVSNLAIRTNLAELESAMQGVDPDFKEGLNHYFGYRTYAREMTLEAGNLVVGKLHRFPCINILSKGKVRVEGEFESTEYTAPHTWVSCAGTKRAIYVIEDCIWTGMWENPTDTRDLEEIEQYLIADDYSALEGPCGLQ